jgi:hypothetical protein
MFRWLSATKKLPLKAKSSVAVEAPCGRSTDHPMENSPPFTIEPVAEQTVKKFGFNKSCVVSKPHPGGELLIQWKIGLHSPGLRLSSATYIFFD